MLFRQRSGYVGIDIGTRTVKLAQLERRRSGYALSNYAVVPRRETINIDHLCRGKLHGSSNEIVVGRSLNGDFNGKLSAGTISMAACDMRTMSVESLDPTVCQRKIAGELEEIERFRSAPREFGFWAAEPDTNSTIATTESEAATNDAECYVNVLSMPTSWAHQIAEDQSVAGWECHVIDGLPQTLARAVEFTRPGGCPIAFLDWGYSRATFGICAGGSPVFVRMLRGSGFGQVIKGLANGLSLSEMHAEKLLLETGIAPPDGATENNSRRIRESDSDQSQTELQIAKGIDPSELQHLIAETIAEPLNNIAQELKRTFEFVGSHRSVTVPEELVLFGGGAGLRNVAPWLTKQCEMTIAPWQCENIRTNDEAPLSILGPAIALSMLAWKEGQQ